MREKIFENNHVSVVTFYRLSRLHNRNPYMKAIDFRRDLLPLKDMIYRLGLRLTGRTQEAEDLTQDTLVKVWNLRDRLGEVESLEAYCLTVCRRMALDRLARKEQSNLSLDESLHDTLDTDRTPEEQVAYDDRLEKVKQLFNALPERLKTAIQLRDIEGLTYKEAALVMETTEDNFKVILHRARKTVKAQYEKIDSYGL